MRHEPGSLEAKRELFTMTDDEKPRAKRQSTHCTNCGNMWTLWRVSPDKLPPSFKSSTFAELEYNYCGNCGNSAVCKPRKRRR